MKRKHTFRAIEPTRSKTDCLRVRIRSPFRRKWRALQVPSCPFPIPSFPFLLVESALICIQVGARYAALRRTPFLRLQKPEPGGFARRGAYLVKTGRRHSRVSSALSTQLPPPTSPEYTDTRTHAYAHVLCTLRLDSIFGPSAT